MRHERITRDTPEQRASALVDDQITAGKINPTPEKRADLERLIAGHARWQRDYEAIREAKRVREMGRVG